MIGSVEQKHLLLPITFCLENESHVIVEFVIDTGFTGTITLPPQTVASLHLPYLHNMPADLADDTTIDIPVHVATILWREMKCDVRILAIGHRPLLGMELLEDHELFARIAEHGLVTVKHI
jgi:clan AA aspartic protease